MKEFKPEEIFHNTLFIRNQITAQKHHCGVSQSSVNESCNREESKSLRRRCGAVSCSPNLNRDILPQRFVKLAQLVPFNKGRMT